MLEASLDLNTLSLEPLGAGGLADVFTATHLDATSPWLTVKVLKRELSRHRVVVSSFERERTLLAALACAFFPRYVSSGKLAGNPFIAYEYVQGETLAEIIASRRVAVAYAVTIYGQLLTALSLLHDRSPSIVHSDISPENILVTPDNGIRLIDFGCAQKLASSTTGASRWIGKPSYLSPEQARGDAWDHRSDLYQAATIFYELLSGHKKIAADDPKRARVTAANPPSITMSLVPLRFRRYLEIALDTRRERRWQTAREHLCALEQNGVT